MGRNGMRGSRLGGRSIESKVAHKPKKPQAWIMSYKKETTIYAHVPVPRHGIHNLSTIRQSLGGTKYEDGENNTM